MFFHIHSLSHFLVSWSHFKLSSLPSFSHCVKSVNSFFFLPSSLSLYSLPLSHSHLLNHSFTLTLSSAFLLSYSCHPSSLSFIHSLTHSLPPFLPYLPGLSSSFIIYARIQEQWLFIIIHFRCLLLSLKLLLYSKKKMHIKK